MYNNKVIEFKIAEMYFSALVSLSMVVLNSGDCPGKNGIQKFGKFKIHLRLGFM